jgi:hypothetical protein
VKRSILLTILLAAVPCSAAIITVEPDGSGDAATIQDAVDIAATGDEIVLAIGTYFGDGNRDIDFGGKSITVGSTNPNDPNIVAATIIDCQNDGRGFYFHSGEDANSVIDGFTITNGSAPGPWSENRGGGICCVGSGPTIKNCTITNSASDRGGGIYSGDESDAMISQCTIIENSASNGGGVFFGNSSTVVNINSTITHCIITGNSASQDGGGINCYNSLYYGDGATIKHCTISGNSAASGGGIVCYNNTPKITNCIISGNSSTCTSCSYGGGGGVYCEWSSPTIDNCIISDNSTASAGVCGGGGGIHCTYNSHPSIGNSTIVNNTTGRDGGGIFCTNSSSVTVVNTIIWSNTADINGPDIGLINCNVHGNRPGRATISYSDVKGGEVEVYVETYCTLNWGAGNINIDSRFADPCNGDYHLKSEAGRWKLSIYTKLDPTDDGFIDLSDFAAFANSWQKEGNSIPADLDNSGLVDFNDLKLLLDNYLMSYLPGDWVLDDVTSPCIDAGNPSSDWSKELWPHGKWINMGAYGGTAEASMSLSTAGNIADFNKDGFVNVEDLALFAEKWPTEELLLAEDINRNGMVNLADWAEFAAQWLWEE